MKLTKEEKENLMSSIFSNKLVFCQQLLLELNLNKCSLSRIYESDFKIIRDQLHHQFY